MVVVVVVGLGGMEDCYSGIHEGVMFLPFMRQ